MAGAEEVSLIAVTAATAAVTLEVGPLEWRTEVIFFGAGLAVLHMPEKW